MNKKTSENQKVDLKIDVISFYKNEKDLEVKLSKSVEMFNELTDEKNILEIAIKRHKINEKTGEIIDATGNVIGNIKDKNKNATQKNKNEDVER